VILLVGGWYFIVCGIATLLPLLLGIESGTDYLGWISAPLLLAVGIGLLKRTLWSRWLAFGMTLVGWTLGTLCLLFFLYFMFGRLGLDLDVYFDAVFSRGPLKVAARLGLLAFVLWVAGIVISFKLFWYLWSEEGCAEFGEPFGSVNTVAASTAVWVFGWLGLLLATGDAQRAWQGLKIAWVMTDPDNGFGRRAKRNPQYDPDRERREYRDSQLRKAMERGSSRLEQDAQERSEQRARERRQQREREMLEAARRAEQIPADAPDYHESVARQQAASGEFEVPSNYGTEAQSATNSSTMTVAQDDEPDSRKILKCRDASGSITFTQNYCPPGTTPVEAAQ
jgi:hypothetical protein